MIFIDIWHSKFAEHEGLLWINWVSKSLAYWEWTGLRWWMSHVFSARLSILSLTKPFDVKNLKTNLSESLKAHNPVFQWFRISGSSSLPPPTSEKNNNTTNWICLHSHLVIHDFAHGSFQQSQSSTKHPKVGSKRLIRVTTVKNNMDDPAKGIRRYIYIYILARNPYNLSKMPLESWEGGNPKYIGDIPSDFHQHSMENGPEMKMYILLTMGIFHC